MAAATGTRAFLYGAVLASAALQGCRSVDEAGPHRPPLLRPSAPETVWDGEQARAPFLIVPFGADELAIADQDAVFALDPATGEARRLGRAGQGPGEFVSVAGLGPADDGGLVIVDGRQLRASRMDAEGDFVASWQLRPPPTLGNASSGPILMAGDGLLRMVWSAGVIRVDGVPDAVALVEHDLVSGTSTTVAEWTGTAWVETPWAMMPASPATGPPPWAADARDRRVRWATHAGCVLSRGAAPDAAADSSCAPIPRVPLKAFVPADSMLAAASVRSTMREVLARKHEFQDLAGDHDAVQRLVVDDGGCVWLRIVKDDAAYDPMLEFTVPATRPAEYEWWVWDTGRDRLAGRIAVPSSFDPQLIRDGVIYGFIDQSDHTRGVARARFDAAALGTCEVP